jgi:hypothetical protein
MKLFVLTLASLCVDASIAGGQFARTRVSSNGPSWIDVQFDGRTLTVVEQVSDGSDTRSNTIRHQYQAQIGDIDFSRTSIKTENGYPFIEFWCQANVPCFQTRRLLPYEDPLDPRRQLDVYCTTLEQCRDLLGRLRPQSGSGPSPVRGGAPVTRPAVPSPPPAPPPKVDCEALRSKYYPAGQRPQLPPECLTDIDRMSVYQPVPRRPAAPAPTAPQETVIDGSRIPSRIDFSKPAPSPVPAPVTPPVAVPPPPSPPTPEPSRPVRPPTSPSTGYRDLFEPLPPPSPLPWGMVHGPLTPPPTPTEEMPRWLDGILDSASRNPFVRELRHVQREGVREYFGQKLKRLSDTVNDALGIIR